MKHGFFLIYKFLVLLVLLVFSMPVFAEENVILMGYKDESKLPLIGDKNDNTGAYLDLFSKAAEMIGYRLSVERYPKKRLYIMFEKGELDFYPGSSFSEERSKYMLFLKNGFETKEVLITKSNIPEITDISKVSGTLLVDLGGSKSNFSSKYKNIKVHEVGSLNFERIIKMLTLNRVDFYIADIEDVDFYKKSQALKSFDEVGIKIHNDTFGDFMPMYMGFAMKSKYCKVKDTPNYDASKPLDYENTPKIAAEDCVAYKFYEALMKLKSSGETKKIYEKYFN